MHTPWDESQTIEKLEEGVLLVTTAGHGGLMVTERYAVKHLSPAARKRGMRFGNYYCYEEDCDCAIALYELPHLWSKLSATEEDLLKSLSYWKAEYLLERGITPLPEQYKYYQRMKTEEKMRAEQNPDLITAVFGEGDTNRKDVCRVVTADGKSHFVTRESYQPDQKELSLLSKCKKIE